MIMLIQWCLPLPSPSLFSPAELPDLPPSLQVKINQTKPNQIEPNQIKSNQIPPGDRPQSILKYYQFVRIGVSYCSYTTHGNVKSLYECRNLQGMTECKLEHKKSVPYGKRA